MGMGKSECQPLKGKVYKATSTGQEYSRKLRVEMFKNKKRLTWECDKLGYLDTLQNLSFQMMLVMW